VQDTPSSLSDNTTQESKRPSYGNKAEARDRPNTPTRDIGKASQENESSPEKPTVRAPQSIPWDDLPKGRHNLDERFRGTALEDSPDDTSKPILERAAGHLRRTEGLIDIGLYGVDGKIVFRRMVIDMGSKVNVMADDVRCDLGIEMDKYTGPAIRVSRWREVEPIGLVEASWRFREYTKVYKTMFLVMKTKNYDVLLGEQFVNKFQIFKRDRRVWAFLR
jgi:hypothetical protein